MQVTKFVYLFDVALTTTEVMLKISDCRMALCGKTSSFLYEASFAASGISVNVLSPINRLATTQFTQRN